jgi:predicted TIM-barrel fold metal-dependent hydrolase
VTAYIDAHVHPPVAEFLDGPIAPYLGSLREQRDEPVAEMAAGNLAEYYRSRNARAVLLGWDSESVTNRRPFSSTDLAAIVSMAPDTFWGLGAVDPSKGAAAVGQVHETARLGLAGVSMYPMAQGRSPSERTTFPVWEAAAGHDLICMFHTGSTVFGANTAGGGGIRLERGRPLHVDAVAAQFPELRIVLAHGGTLWLDEAVAVASHKSNVYLCVGGQSPARLGEEVIEAITGPLADRVIFGSGFPFAGPDEWIAKLERLDLPPDFAVRLMRDNAAQLLEPA